MVDRVDAGVTGSPPVVGLPLDEDGRVGGGGQRVRVTGALVGVECGVGQLDDVLVSVCDGVVRMPVSRHRRRARAAR